MGSVSTLENFSRQSLNELISRLRPSVGPGERAALRPRPNPSEPAPLSYAQQRLWFLDLLEPGQPTYNLAGGCRLRGHLDPAALKAAFDFVAGRHEALRTEIIERDGEALQRVRPRAAVPLRVVDLSALPALASERLELELARGEVRRGFELGRGPLVRALLLRTAPDRHLLALTLHHIIADGWSIDILLGEVARVYSERRLGLAAALPALPVQYADFALWQRLGLTEARREALVAYWRDRLAGLPERFDLPTDRPRTAAPSSRGERFTTRLEAPLVEALTELGNRHRTSLFTLLFAAFGLLLARTCGLSDFALGTPTAGRRHPALETLIGFFVNTLLLRFELADDPTVDQLIERARETAEGAFEHEELPYALLVEKLAPHRDGSHAPFLQVVLALQNTPRRELRLGELELERVELSTATAKFDLSFEASPERGGLRLDWERNTALYDGTTARRLAAQLARLLAAMVARPAARVGELELLSPEERFQLTTELNDTDTGPAEHSVVDLLENVLRARPDAVAVVEGEAWTSYGELDRRTARWARALVRRGIQPESRVGLLLPRGSAMVEATVAILRAGAVYLPLDPAYPAERLALLVQDARPAGVIVAGAGALPSELEALRLDVAALDSVPAGGLDGAPAELARVSADQLAYVMYTSGSTGRPKGVGIPHAGIVRLAVRSRFGRFDTRTTLLHLSSPSFDASTIDLWCTLLHGGRLVIFPHGPGSIAEIAETIERERINALFATTGLFNRIAEESPPGLESLALLMTGGEAASPVHFERFRLALPNADLVNLYGPTENTTATTAFAVRGGEAVPALLPIGRPIADTTVHVVDRRLRRLGMGAPGELLTGGRGLARGYLGRPAQTAAAFVPDPFGEVPGARLYRTGDLARWRADGELEYLGRIDQQVKLRGFRIEPGEIEAALLALPGVAQALVLVRDDLPGGHGLVAYVVLAGEAAPRGRTLRAALARTLPEFMLPAFFVELERLPLTPAGKIDRRALPPPAREVNEVERGRAPEGPIEELVAALFAELLGHERFGAEESFFELGGHSLLATRLLARLRDRLEVSLPLQVVFEDPTVRGLAHAVAERLAAAAPAPAAPAMTPSGETHDVKLGGTPLSFAQERLWFLDRLEGPSAVYNVPVRLGLTGPLDVPALHRALATLLERHAALRTIFRSDSSEPRQSTLPAGAYGLPSVDLAGLSAHDVARLAREGAERLARQPFDLDGGPLLRMVLLRRGPSRHELLINAHHAVCDGWSVGVFLRELGALYRPGAREVPALPPLPLSYGDFARWQRRALDGGALAPALEFWRRELGEDHPSLELPVDRPRTGAPGHRGLSRSLALPPSFGAQLQALGRRAGATPFMLLASAFALQLARLSGNRRVRLGVPVAGRDHSAVEPLIGLFVNTVVLDLPLEGEASFLELLALARRRTLAAFSHQEIPFEALVAALAPERHLGRSPLFEVLFVVQNAPLAPPALEGLAVEVEALDTGTAKFDLSLAWIERDGGWQAVLEADRDLFDPSTAQRLLAQLGHLLRAALEAPERPAWDLPLLGAAERWQLLGEWNDTAAPAPRGRLHDAFFVSARERPEATALVTGGEHLSCAHLAARARALAARLVEHGVGPELTVGVCLHRTPELVVSLLAVLAAGGAYVPLDPAYPRERLSWMLEDSGAGLLLASAESSAALAGAATGVRRLDPADVNLLAAASAPALPEADEANLAYLIFTSGSTGRPKAVAIAHRAAVAMVDWALGRWPGRQLEAVAATTSVCFDLSVFELFVPLSRGGRVLLADNALDLLEPGAADAATLLNTVPSALAELVRARALPPRLECINLAGEPLRKRLVEDLFALRPVDALYNLYGPSEDTTYSTEARLPLPPGEHGEPTIGRPIAATRAHVLDRRFGHVPIGVPGLLFLAGEGLARGYLHRPAATAERFLPNPYALEPGERMYATGDLVRLAPDGQLIFLGRVDHQVKVRGFRIELGEIESAVLAEERVVEAAVLVREDRPGDAQIAAYVVARDPASTPALEAALRQRLAERLPAHMLPAHWIWLERLPRTPNGKLRRDALPAPSHEPRPAAGAGTVSPITELLALAFADVLGLPAVAPGESFFQLGGHSLLATRLVSRLRLELGVELPLKALFEAPTPAGLAARVEARLGGGDAPSAIEPGPLAGDLPLSFSQERLWFLDRFHPGTATYNMPACLELDGPLDAGALVRALAEVVRRHASLRTTFHELDGRPAQRIAESSPATVLPLVDLAGLSPSQAERIAGRLFERDRTTGFELARRPLLRARLLRLGTHRHRLTVNVHHIVSDGWSMQLLIRELSALYAGALRGERAPGPASMLPPLPVQYADHARWQRRHLSGEVLERQLAYWRGKLGGELAPLELPADFPRPAVQTYRGESLHARIEPALTGAARELARASGCTLFMTLLAAFKGLLARWSGQDDITVGAPIAGRTRAETEGLIGFFLNTLVLRTDLGGDPSFRQLLARVRTTALEAYAHQELPFEKLLDELKPERDLSRTPFFQVLFNFLNLPAAEPTLEGLEIRTLATPDDPSKFDLTLYLSERDGALEIHAVWNADLFARERIEELLRQLTLLLEQAVAAPDAPLSSHRLRTAAAPLPDPTAPLSGAWVGAVQELFSRRARLEPAALAVADGAERWTYGELEAASNRLAHHLLASGLPRGGVVAIYAHRGAAMARAVLAVLKAGGAFLALDPAHPPGRTVELMRLGEARAFLHLTAAGALPAELAAEVQGLGPGRSFTVSPRAEEAESTAEIAVPAPELTFGPDDLAYIAFTSGSTGQPKGVEGRHGPLSHFLPWQAERFGLGPADRYSMLSGLAHDPLQRDLFTPLCLGGAVFAPSAEDYAAPERLRAWMAREGLTVAHLTPALGQVLAEHAPEETLATVPSLRWILLVGDALTRRDVARLRAVAPNARIVNLYGSTETQRSVSYHVVDDEDDASTSARQVLPLGRGIEDVQLLLLTPGGLPAGVGELAEITVRGPNLARGYFGDAELTAKKFVANPFTATPGDRLYRTGDLGRYLPNGEVAFAGRADTQVKVRGFRVELAEIEGQLGRMEGVRECVVLARPDARGETQLTAFLVPETGRELEPAAARAYLRERVPSYMVPASARVLAALPLTPNRKIDRRALAVLAGEERPAAARFEAPASRAEQQIAAVVREVLGLARVGVDENFFDLGGNSLALVRFHTRLRQVLGVEISLVELFAHPTVGQLARLVTPAAAPPGQRAEPAVQQRRLEVGRGRIRQQLARRQGLEPPPRAGMGAPSVPEELP